MVDLLIKVSEFKQPNVVHMDVSEIRIVHSNSSNFFLAQVVHLALTQICFLLDFDLLINIMMLSSGI